MSTKEELEGELRRVQRRLETKERELREIHQSRAWALVTRLRSLKLRLLDPLLGAFGMEWPRRRSAPIPANVQRIEAARADRYDVVCFSACDWDARFQRPQQLMLQFAAAGHRVFYVSQQFDGVSIAEKHPNVYEVMLSGAVLHELEALRDKAAINRAVMILHLPSWWPLAQQARARFGWPIVYDCFDLHSEFLTVRRSIVVQEEELLAKANVVVASSEPLARRRDDVVIVRNGCDYEHFASTPRANNARPVIGYYGAISDWFDADLVADLAERRRDWDFLLVGSTYGASLSRLARQPNVSLPGEEPYEWLPQILGRFDVAIIPFRRTPLTEATNPVKMYEILAAGKPLVSVPIPEVAALAPLVRLASTAAEFEREIEIALVPDAAAEEARRAFAREHTWKQRFETFRSAVAYDAPAV